MNRDLIIVESPTKAKIITKFLGGEYKVVSSKGHVRDLPAKRLGVDVDNNFAPEYEVNKRKKRILKKLKKLVKNYQKIYFAMDEDREGEAIAWHLADILNIDYSSSRADRIAFHQITESTVRESLKNPRKISMDLVNAQQARRILDRLVGYKISPLLSKKIRVGLSAGRVQSIGLSIVAEREKKRQKFSSQKYYTIEGLLTGSADKAKKIKTKLWGRDGKKYKKLEIQKKQADKIIEECANKKAEVTKIQRNKRKKYAKPPYITSTLQQAAYSALKFTPAKTMRIAQQLYEGVELPDGTSTGLITYMRTDSFKIARSAIESAREYIKNTYEGKYLPRSPNTFKSKKSAQEAHECIRPTAVKRKPEYIKSTLTRDQFKLYKIIWQRLITSQMSPAVVENITVKLKCKNYEFRSKGKKILFDGYTKLWSSKWKENILPQVTKGENYIWDTLKAKEHETKPPPRFTPATLVKRLEKNGIGRPSTYASIIKTLFKRKYVKSIKGSLAARDIGILVNDVLKEHFPSVMNKKFTARMEDKLDKIAAGKLDWKKMLKGFYTEFKKEYESAVQNMDRLKDQKIDKECPRCSSPMVIRRGRNGKFVACTAYPDCKQTFPLDEDGEIIKPKTTQYKCPECGSSMVIKRGKYGKFLACSEYPECRTTRAVGKNEKVITIPLDYQKCPECGENTVVKSGPRGKFIACTAYPKCKFTISLKKADGGK
ncbi:MAG: type I DNA topoisomerase [Elusimicrobiota bacterium]